MVLKMKKFKITLSKIVKKNKKKQKIKKLKKMMKNLMKDSK